MDNKNDDFEESIDEVEYIDDGVETSEDEEVTSMKEEFDNYNTENISNTSSNIRNATLDENGNMTYKKAPKKTRDATMDENGNFTKKRNSLLPPKKARDAMMDENGNFTKRRNSLLPPKKARDANISLDDNEESSSNNNNSNVKGLLSGLKPKNPMMKLLLIGGGSSFLSLIIFIVILIAPLMVLGIIDISDLGSGLVGSVSASGYTDVTNNTEYWWPVATTTPNIKYDHGTPVSTSITSSFGDQESFRNSGHGGIDIGNAGNGPGIINIIASKSGVVTYPNDLYQTSYQDKYGKENLNNRDGGGFGNYVMIDHQDGTMTVYAHLAQDSITVTAGEKVEQGQVIGKMGSSGRSTATHLHFEVRVNGTKVFPLDYVDATNPRPIKKETNYINGNSNKQSVCLSLKANEFSTNGTIALMTNIYRESSFNTGAYGDGGTSYGLCQWHNDRFTNLQNTFPDTYHTVEGQINFLMYELTNDYPSLYNDLLKGTSSPEDLTYQFCKIFERPYEAENECTKRKDMTKDFTNYVTNNCQ